MRSTLLTAARTTAVVSARADQHLSPRRTRPRRPWRSVGMLASVPLVSVLLIGTAFTESAGAAVTVQLGTATPFAVLAGTAVTDVPTSSITGDVGLSPATGAAYAGLTQAEVTGSIYSTDGTGPAGTVNNPALLTTAQNDLTTAYVAAAGQSPTSTFAAGDNQLGGQTLTAGVYAFGHAATANITAASPLVLNGQGDANAVFVFQASSDLVTASNSVVQLENGAQACNVFWQVSSSATLSTSSTFVGTIMALTSATLDSGATVQGRVLARNGDVTLDANTITVPPSCTPAVAATTAAPVSTAAATTTVPTGTIPTTATPVSGAAPARSTGTTTAIPLGAPGTGLGGASHSRDGGLIGAGAVLVGAAGTCAVVACSRRRASASRLVTASPSAGAE